MSVGWRRRESPAAPARVASLEHRLGNSLPQDYREFLLAQDGGEPADNAFATPEGDNESGVNEFLGLSDLERELGEAMPDGCIPVAYAEGGNLVFLELLSGRVLFWDHELGGSQALVELAASFEAFLEALRPFDVSEVQLKPGQVKSAWIDPDLLA